MNSPADGTNNPASRVPGSNPRPGGAAKLGDPTLALSVNMLDISLVVKYDNKNMLSNTRPLSWIKAARKEFESFPDGAQDELFRALTVIAEGGSPDIAKPLTGLGTGVVEVALRYRRGAYRVV